MSFQQLQTQPPPFLASPGKLGLTPSSGVPLNGLSHRERTGRGCCAAIPGWGGVGAGKALFCVTQTSVMWPPPSQAVRFLSVSSELDVLLGKWMRICVCHENLPAEILIPLLQIYQKLSSLFS